MWNLPSTGTDTESNRNAPSSSKNEARPRMVTLRAVLIALIIMPFNSLWQIMMEVIRYSGHPSTISLFFNVVFILTVLIILNTLVRSIRPKWALDPGELLTVYIMLGLATAMDGHDMIEVLTPILAHVRYFAKPDNGWLTDIVPFVPKWLSITDPRALRDFYLGNSSLYKSYNWHAWLIPVLSWSGFLTTLCFVMLCINTLLRKQWTESEKLSYPLVQLPLEMVNPKTQLFRGKLFWTGVAISAILELWNGFAFLYPSIPMLPLKFNGPSQDLATYMTTRPWNAIGWTPVAIYPFGIALGMLLPLDLLFSAWFFAWVWRLESVFGAMYGYSDIPGFPYMESQSFGAYIGIALSALWVSRSHFIRIWAGLFDRKINLEDKNEPISYRLAVAGIVLGVILIYIFCRAAGMSTMLILLFFLIYFVLAIAVTRMRAELGPPAHDMHYSGPDSIITSITSANTLPRQDLAMFSMFWGFNRAYRSHPAPIQLEGMKMVERTTNNYRGLFAAMMLAVLFGSLCAFWADLSLTYHHGAAEKIAPPNVQLIFGGEPWNRMYSWIHSPSTPTQQFNTRVAIGVGFAITLILNILRLRLGWFPFHPVGFAVSSSWSLSLLWLPLMIAWVIKLLILRYGGLRAYRQALPLFLGLILGECILGSIWMLVGIALNIQTYAFWP
jgi:hypothetical protein